MERPAVNPEHHFIFFFTATINNWMPLLAKDTYKMVVINSLQYLSVHNKIDVFAFVIMPTHIHFLWRIKEKNGKESPQGSFLKYTAHVFKKMLKQEDMKKLEGYKKAAHNKDHEFWQTKPRAIAVGTARSAERILDYIHNNPLSKHWELALFPEEYQFSSAAFTI
jgi:putative transposase